MKEKVIDGVKFTVAPFRSMESLRLLPYLTKKIGPPLAQIIGALKNGLPKSGDILDVKLDGEMLSQSIEKLMEHLGEDEFEALIKRMFKNVTAGINKDGKSLLLTFATDETFEASMDIVFIGKTLTVFQVLFFVIEVNFPDFFGKMARGFGLKIKQMVTSEPGEENSKNEQSE